MSEWQTVELSDLGEIFDGPHATPERKSDGPYFMNIASLSNGRLDLAHSDHVAESDFTRWTRRVTPRADDLLFSYETRLGQAALMPRNVRGCLGRRMALLRPNTAAVDPRFLLYSYMAPEFQSVIAHNTIHGATVNRIPLNRMGSWQLRIPPLPEQQAIAEVLGALDDKIAANNSLARSAELLAQTVYDIAEQSAQRQPMSRVLKPILGGTPSREIGEYWGGSELWVSAKDITAADASVIVDTDEHITAAAAATTKAKPLPAGSVILTARGTVGKVARLAAPASFNQSCYGFIPGALPSSILYFAIRSATDHAKAISHGSVFDTITMSTFDHLQIADFDTSATAMLEAELRPLLDAVTIAVLESRTLAATRDALLPRLMSGKLRVRDAERIAEEAGA